MDRGGEEMEDGPGGLPGGEHAVGTGPDEGGTQEGAGTDAVKPLMVPCRFCGAPAFKSYAMPIPECGPCLEISRKLFSGVRLRKLLPSSLVVRDTDLRGAM